MTKTANRQFETAPTVEIASRQREIQLILNVIQPDPEYQPSLLTDEASLLDACGLSRELIAARLADYFGEPFPFQLTTPLWCLVDLAKSKWPWWPDDWPPESA